jgi:peptidoglycan/LPS O-acetylase OafA/YrhL
VFGSLWTAPLRFLGYISYGLYLYHLIIYFRVYDVLVRHISNASLRISLQGAFARLFLAGALSIFISWLSRKYFEEYFLRLKSGSTS